MTPRLQQIVRLVGRRADDPEVVDFVTNTLGKQVPDSTTDIGGLKYVVVKKQGIELGFGHDLKNDKYPLINKSKKSYVPYLQIAWLSARFGEPLPSGQEAAGLVDPGRDIVLNVEPGRVTVMVDQALELSSRHGVPAPPVVGLFVGWAALRDLLDETRLRAHADLLAAVRRRERQGSALVAAAWPRGLWGSHLKDLPGLRQFAHGWFHNIGGSFIRDDLVAVFGARTGPTGHAEPVLDDDDWAAVDLATPTLDGRFGAWVKVPA